MGTTNFLTAPPVEAVESTASPASAWSVIARPVRRRPRRAERMVNPMLGGLGEFVSLACGVALLQLDALVHPPALPVALFAAGIASGVLLRAHGAAALAAMVFVVGAWASLWAQGALTGTVMLLVVLLTIPVAAGARGGVAMGAWLEERLGDPARA
jgi:hypothetical protein